MLNTSDVLEYIKDNLGFPHMHIELSDEEILKVVKKVTLREFSKYFPFKAQLGINLNLPINKVPGYQNRWYVYEPNGLEILNISDLITSCASDMFFGHSPFGVLSYNEVPEFMLSAEMARTAKKWSRFNCNVFFYPPNIMEIRPIPNDQMVIIEYETMQPEDLSGIPLDLSQIFQQLALAEVQIRIGRIRKYYGEGNLKTPFGTIDLNGDSLFQEGKESKREIIEMLTKGSFPNIIVSFG